jgi:hypothetical protein
MLRGHSQDSIRLGHIRRAARLDDVRADTEMERREKLKASLAGERHSLIGLEKKTSSKN